MNIDFVFTPKLWGGEYLITNTELYCAKYLVVNPGYQCSLHRHLVKDETFIVVEGGIQLECGDELLRMTHGMRRVKPGTWHRFSNKMQHLAVILEVSTHHSDDDVERKEESRRLSQDGAP